MVWSLQIHSEETKQEFWHEHGLDPTRRVWHFKKTPEMGGVRLGWGRGGSVDRERRGFVPEKLNLLFRFALE